MTTKNPSRTRKVQPMHVLWLLTPSAIAVELARKHGYHGVCYDLEHGAFNRESVDALILLGRSLGLVNYARVAAPTRIDIQQALDSGGDGVILPHIDDLAHAREICATAKYPPLGTRSVGGGRSWGWGDPPPAWVRKENRRVQCFPMIETAGALAEVDAIAALHTVDGLFLGPADLNMAMGRRGTMGADDDADLVTVAEAAAGAGKHWGMNVYSERDRKIAKRHHLRLVALQDDVTALSTSLDVNIADAKRDIG